MTGDVYIVWMIRTKLTQIFWVRSIDAIGYVISTDTFYIFVLNHYIIKILIWRRVEKMNEAHKLTLCLRHIQIYNLKYTTAYKNGYPGVVVVAISAL